MRYAGRYSYMRDYTRNTSRKRETGIKTKTADGETLTNHERLDAAG
jgi:hypothetical protein